MALEAVVCSVQDPLITSYSCCSKEYNLYSGSVMSSNNFGMNYEFANYSSMLLEEDNHMPLNNYEFSHPKISTTPISDILIDNLNQWDDHHHQQQHQQYVCSNYASPEEYLSGETPPPMVTNQMAVEVAVGGGARRKRRRRSSKNKEEVEQQRMTHIAVERNRRKQMNEYLAVIRSLMPPSYVQRGDQASIVAGAINYVKELEQMLQSMDSQKRNKSHNQDDNQEQEKSSPPFQGGGDNNNVVNVDTFSENIATQPRSRLRPPVFSDFFSFPQYSTRSNQPGSTNSVSSNSGVGDIEVTMVDSHANVKILAKKQPKQLVKLIAGFQGLRLIVLHLNVTTVDSYVLYSLSLKAEEGCQLNSVDDIAAAANHILGQIQEEAASSL